VSVGQKKGEDTQPRPCGHPHTGLGPIPWLILAELFPPYAVTSAASVAVVVNWSCNFLVGATYLPIETLLGAAGWLPFAGILGAVAIFIGTSVPETTPRAALEPARTELE